MKVAFKLIVLVILLSLGSCALKPIPSSFDYVKIENVKLEDLGNGKILIYNAADWKHTIDKTDRLNLWIDNKEAGQIRAKEYVIYKLDFGTRGFRLLHLDLGKFNSSHIIKVNKNTKVIEVSPTVLSNEAFIVNSLPVEFNKFKPAYHRK